jgi:predicted lactoylglutathione lyase
MTTPQQHTAFTPATIALPVEDRRRAFSFYGEGLGFATPGDPAEDGVPEPLRVVVNESLWLMLIPTGGFGWVTAGSGLAARGTVEFQLSVTAAGRKEVDDFMDVARAAGAKILSEAQEQGWGYCGVFADPDGHQWMILEQPSPLGWRMA